MAKVLPFRSGPPRPRFAVLTPYAAAGSMVGAAALAGFVVQHLLARPSVALIFVLPVLLAGVAFGWGASLFAALAGTLTFDVLFVEPRFSLTVASPSDMWALSLLLTVAGVASTVAARARRQRLAAQAAAARAERLQGLAHLVIEGAPRARVLEAAAEALSQSFGAPAVILSERGEQLRVIAAAGGAGLSAGDREAALWTLQHGRPVRAQEFPFDAALYDLWPINRRFGEGLVIGIFNAQGEPALRTEREAQVQLVGAYVAAAATPPLRAVAGRSG